MCAAAENLSFLSAVEKSSTPTRLPAGVAPTRALNRSKSYVTFQTNEGDTPKSAIGLQHVSLLRNLPLLVIYSSSLTDCV